MRPTTEEVITAPKFSRNEELETNFSSMATKVRKSHALTPYIPPHGRFGALDARKDKNLRSKYKTQKILPRHKQIHMLEMSHHSKYKMKKSIPGHKHAHMPKICCNFIPGTKRIT